MKKIDFNQRAIDFIDILQSCSNHYRTSKYAKNGDYFFHITHFRERLAPILKILLKLDIITERWVDDYDFDGPTRQKIEYRYNPEKFNTK